MVWHLFQWKNLIFSCSACGSYEQKPHSKKFGNYLRSSSIIWNDIYFSIIRVAEQLRHVTLCGRVMMSKKKNPAKNNIAAPNPDVRRDLPAGNRELLESYQKRIEELIEEGNTERLERALAPRKYEAGVSYVNDRGQSSRYDKTAMKKSNSWAEANKEQFLMVMNIGMKAVLKAALPAGDDKLGPYLIRLAREDILRRVDNGELDPEELIRTYQDSVKEYREKLKRKHPDNIYAANGFKVDPLIDELNSNIRRAGDSVALQTASHHE